MGTHDAAVAAHASLALIVEMLKHLAAKGLLTDQEYLGLLNNAIRATASDSNGPAIAALIKESAKAS